jgi:hypothetical protein
MKTKITTAFALMLVAALPAAAQTVYRCGNTYSQQPCVGGTAVETPPPAPGAKEQAQRREATQRDAKAADAMEKARLKDEAKPAQVYVPPEKAQVPSTEQKPAMAKPKKPEYFTAVAPGTKPAKKKAQKTAKKASAPV